MKALGGGGLVWGKRRNRGNHFNSIGKAEKLRPSVLDRKIGGYLSLSRVSPRRVASTESAHDMCR